MVIGLEILFLTTLLLDHLLNYLHTVTLGGPQSWVLPSLSSHPLGSLPHRGPCSYKPGLCQVGKRFLDHHSASYRRNSWENKIKDKKRVKNLPSVPGKFESLYFSLDPLGWVSYTSHLHNPLQGRGAGGDVQEVWPSRMIQAHKNPELLLPLLGWIYLNSLLFFFQWSFL